MTKVTIDRELLERLAGNGPTSTISATRELREILAAPRQPEGDGLEVRATEEHRLTNGGVEYYDLCRLPDAQRAIAELRDRLDVMTQCADNYSRMFEESAEECEHWKSGANAEAARADELKAERDTLRQQLAERDATIERLEAGIPRIQEQSHQMRQQRDKLAVLLREKFPRIDPEKPYPLDEGEHHCEYTLYQERERLHREIDAALAEVK